MTVQMDLYGRYHSAFGYVAKLGIIEANKALIRANVQKYKEQSYAQQEDAQMSLFVRGDATFADFKLNNVKTNTLIAFGLTENNERLDGVLAPPPMVSFSRGKNIKTTIIDNSDFEVVESFGTQNWNISIDGLLIDMDNHWYPGELLKTVSDMFAINDTFEVCGQVFDDLGISELYFDDLSDISFLEGYVDTIKFKLKAKSIKPAEFFM